MGDRQQPLEQRSPSIQLLGVIGGQPRGVHPVVQSRGAEAERRVGLPHPDRVGPHPPAVPPGHHDQIDHLLGDLLREQHREERDQEQDPTQDAERVQDQVVGNGQQPVDQGPPVLDLQRCFDPEPRRIRAVRHPLHLHGHPSTVRASVPSRAVQRARPAPACGKLTTVSEERSEVDREADIRGLDRLLELQEIDLSIARLEARRSELEVGDQLRAARDRVIDAEARMGELQLALDSVANEQRRLENDIDSIQRKIDAERTRLYDGSVANAKELQSIEAEVGSLQARKSRLEDELIDQMERREDMETRLKPLEAEAAEARERLAEIEEGSAREFVEVEKALGERNAEREAMLPAFGQDVLDLYDDLRLQKKGIGAAALVDGVCQACHQKLSPMYLDRMKRERGIRRCEYCRRILIFT